MFLDHEWDIMNSWYRLCILFEIDFAIFYTNLHELFCQFISQTNWVNSGKFMHNCWISCQVMADMKKVYNNLIIINLYFFAGIIYHAAMTWIKRVDHPQSGLQVEKISTRFNKMECTSGHRLWISNFLVILLAIAPSLAIGKWKNSNWP